MTKTSNSPTETRGKPAGADDRQARLAAALRENLRRRKRQAAARTEGGGRDAAPSAPERGPKSDG